MRYRAGIMMAAAVALAACSSKSSTNPGGGPNPPPAGKINVTPASVTLQDSVGRNPKPDTLMITADSGKTLKGLKIDTITYDSAAKGRAWLTATLSGDSAPARLILTVKDSGMAAGTYTATVPIAATGAANTPFKLPVSLTLGTVAVPPPDTTHITGNVVLAVGNTRCNSANIAAIRHIIDSIPNATVINLGDMTMNPGGGTYADFTGCYDPVMGGTLLSRTYAVLGSWEENDSAWAPGADQYFGAARVGPPGKNIYQLNIGSWRVLMLHVITGSKRTYGNNSYELDWLDTALVHDSAFCTLAVWHDPMWYSSDQDTTGQAYPLEHPNEGGLWRSLYAANADVVLNGGQHEYERIGPLRYDLATNKPVADSARGLLQFNNGLGGDGSYTAKFIQKNSDYQSAGVGVLKLTLGDSAYAWEFINAPGSNVKDKGTGRCH